jgi:acetyl esterase/lipase
MLRTTIFLSLFAPVTLLAQSRDYPPTFDGAREEVYKRAGDVELKVWVFDPPKLQPSDKRPAIVFFFGGGWKGGNPGQFEQHCRYLASQGMVAMTADYRVRTRHDTLAVTCVSDAKSAIRWVRQNADRLGVDPDRIAAGGGSAGGHLAACTAVIAEFDEPTESSEVSSVPNALALFNPAVLLAPFDDVTLDEEKIADIATRTGVAPERISPIHHVRSGLPPTIIFHGEADPTVPFATVARYADIATAEGNRCELVGYRGENHGFFNYGRNGIPGEYYPATIVRLQRFLHSLEYLEAEPGIDVPRSANVHLRSHFDHSRIAFDKQKKGTVVFIGGSITKMNGYRVKVENTLRERFPDTEFQFHNAGISSTCSTTGAFRLTRDVLSVNPDLLFVEFAVNDDQDAAHAARDCRRGMEGILRQAREHNPRMDVVVTHFVNPSMLESLQRDETPISSGEHEAVAKHYGVSTIDLAREVAERISAGKLSWEEYGGTHPKDPGNQLAADGAGPACCSSHAQEIGFAQLRWR